MTKIRYNYYRKFEKNTNNVFDEINDFIVNTYDAWHKKRLSEDKTDYREIKI